MLWEDDLAGGFVSGGPVPLLFSRSRANRSTSGQFCEVTSFCAMVVSSMPRKLRSPGPGPNGGGAAPALSRSCLKIGCTSAAVTRPSAAVRASASFEAPGARLARAMTLEKSSRSSLSRSAVASLRAGAVMLGIASDERSGTEVERGVRFMWCACGRAQSITILAWSLPVLWSIWRMPIWSWGGISSCLNAARRSERRARSAGRALV